MNTNDPTREGDKLSERAPADPPPSSSPPPTGNNAPPPTSSAPPPTASANPPPPTTGGNAPPPATGGTSPPTTGGTAPPPIIGESLLPTGGPIIGDGGVLQPVADAANGGVTELNNEVHQIGQTVGLGHLVGDLTDVVESTGLGHIGEDAGPNGNTNLVTDIVQAPTDILAGNLDGTISDVSNDLSAVVTETYELKDEALLEGNDPVNVVPELVESIGGGLQTLPLLNAGGSGLLGGTVGNLSNSSSGHLIDIGLGSTSNDGLSLDLLSNSGNGPGPALGIHVLDVGPNGPSLLDLHLLGGEIPLLGGTEGEGLLGNVLPQLGGEGLLGGLGSALSGSDNGGLLGVIDIPTLGGVGGDGLVGNILGSVAPSDGGATDPLSGLPAAGIVGELVAEVTDALDLGQSQHNHGLLGVL